MFDKFNAELLRIKKGAPQENAYVERVHKSDDSEFYIPRLRGVESVDEFLKLAHRWNVFYNLERPHSGKNMNGNTPFEKAKSLLPTLNTRIALMPPLLLDSLIKDKLFTWDYGENLRDLYKTGEIAEKVLIRQIFCFLPAGEQSIVTILIIYYFFLPSRTSNLLHREGDLPSHYSLFSYSLST